MKFVLNVVLFVFKFKKLFICALLISVILLLFCRSILLFVIVQWAQCYLLNGVAHYLLSGTEKLWIYILLIPVIPSLFCTIMLAFVRESPRFLLLDMKDQLKAEKGTLFGC